MKTVGILLVIATVVKSAPQGRLGFQPVTSLQSPDLIEDTNVYPSAQYEFQYDVSEPLYGSAYGHSEVRDGSYTQGSYYVQLPDSRLLKVEYIADEYGYHPTITYEGEAFHPNPPNTPHPHEAIKQGPPPHAVSPGRLPPRGRRPSPTSARVPSRVSGLVPGPFQNDVIPDRLDDRFPRRPFPQSNLIPSSQHRVFQPDFVGAPTPSRFFSLPSTQPVF
ncbi:hypothetical protein SK128_016156 [Halocaridina rubra]|uniref:Pro-resilin n=1 Tax=Halocaridina rubra TaxID=373956 RepID=A0AAN8X3Z9_HALRR